MTAVIRRQEHPIDLQVRGDDDTNKIWDMIFGFELRVDAQRIWRRRNDRFAVLVKRKDIRLAKIMRLGNPQNDRLVKRREMTKQSGRLTSGSSSCQLP